MKSIFLFLALFSSLSAVFGQTPAGDASYSESNPYRPRADPYAAGSKNKGDKPKRDEKSKNAEVAAAQGPMGPPSLRVSVLDADGRPVPGLTPADFRLLLDGAEVRVESVRSAADEPVNYIFLFDASPSASSYSKYMVEQANRFFGKLLPGDRVMAVAFDDRATVLCELTDDVTVLDRAIKKVSKASGNGTSLYDLLLKVSERYVPAMSGPTAVIFFTDGVDTTSTKAKFVSSLAAAEATSAQYYIVYLETLDLALGGMPSRPLGFPAGFNQPNLGSRNANEIKREYKIGIDWVNDLVLLSGGRAGKVPNPPSDLPQVLRDLPLQLRSQYVISFTPPAPPAGGRHEVKVRVNRPALTVIARGSYLDPTN